MRNKLIVVSLIGAAFALRVQALDLLQRYPTTLTLGDASPEKARPWEFTENDLYQVSQFKLEIGTKFRVQTGQADVGIAHCADGAVWAVVMPRVGGTLRSSETGPDEAIVHIWLRFHPSLINVLFPPNTVSPSGATEVMLPMRQVADAKFRSSWHAGMNAMIPEPKDLTVDADTKEGPRRFFVVDTEAGKTEYVAAFERQSVSRSQAPESAAAAESISLESAPPVVVRTVPAAGATDVDPNLTELTVTFSKPMRDGSWSWSTWGQDTFPEITGKIHYLEDGRTCVLPVKLQPGKFYASWLNSNKFRNFTDTKGTPSVPYLLTFRTAGP
jgi:hypothetical protein